jgi:outer membrane protein TolC|tara:strand:+ start:3306 stop:4055 length:750 start_codon:yes stop_codon:yes gene_type:complete
MKKSFNIFLVIILGLFIFQSAQAQTPEAESADSTINEFILPPIEAVIDSVVKRNGMVNFRNQHIEVMESTLASERIYWTRNLSLQANTRYGNLSNFATAEDGISNTAALTTSIQFNYSVGVALNFPLYDAINRKNQLKLAKLEIDEAKSMAEFQEEEVRQRVIVLYQNIIFTQKVLQIRSSALGDARVNMQMIEKEFRNGIVPISEYVRLNNITSRLEVEYESAMSEFIIAKRLLEDMAGFVFGLTLSN